MMQSKEMKPEEMDSFLEWMTHVCTRPAMYMGTGELKTVLTFLGGYSFGFKYGRGIPGLIGGWEPLDTFLFLWLRIKFTVNHPAWGARQILLHFHDHDERKAVQAIPVLFKEYLGCSPDDLKEDLLDEKILAAYGTDCGAPVCATCVKPSYTAAPTEPALIELPTTPNLPMPKGWMGELEKDALLVRAEEALMIRAAQVYNLQEELKAEKEAAEKEAERLRLDEL